MLPKQLKDIKDSQSRLNCFGRVEQLSILNDGIKRFTKRWLSFLQTISLPCQIKYNLQLHVGIKEFILKFWWASSHLSLNLLMLKAQSRKSAFTKCLTQINDLANGLGCVASGLWQKSKACRQLSLTSLPAALKLKHRKPLMMASNLLQRKGHWPNRMTCLYTRYAFYFFKCISLVILNNITKALHLGYLTLQTFLWNWPFPWYQGLKTVILVCKLFCNIYLPIYSSCYRFSLGQHYLSLHKVQDFNSV